MHKIIPLKWPGLLLLFGLPAILNLIACKLAIPYVESLKVMPIEVTYFIGAIYLCGKDIGSF